MVNTMRRLRRVGSPAHGIRVRMRGREDGARSDAGAMCVRKALPRLPMRFLLGATPEGPAGRVAAPVKWGRGLRCSLVGAGQIVRPRGAIHASVGATRNSLVAQ